MQNSFSQGHAYDDQAGRKAAVRAYDILRTFSSRLQTSVLSGKDPAEILQTEGPEALRTILQHQVQPLSNVVIDAHFAHGYSGCKTPQDHSSPCGARPRSSPACSPPRTPTQSGR